MKVHNSPLNSMLMLAIAAAAFLLTTTPPAIVMASSLSTSPSSGVVSHLFDQDIATLHWWIRAEQWNDTIPCDFPAFQMGHEKGKFRNAVHFNYVGGEAEQLIRAFGLEDNNMFVTSFVLEALFEGMLLAPDVAPPNDLSISDAVNAIFSLKDKNLPADVPVFGFWPQLLINSSNPNLPPSWEQWPINLAGGAAEGRSMDLWLKQVFTDLGLLNLWDDFGPQLAQWLFGIEILMQIPSDSDDTAVVLALQHFFNRVKHLVPNAYGMWNSSGYVPSKAFNEILAYSYCPASPELDRNLIDPRTYFWSHEYFNNVTDPKACFVATWLQNISFATKVALNQSSGPQMPLNVNNVDPTVCSNAVYSISTALLHGTEDASSWFTADMKSLYLNTADFVHFALSTQPWQRRPDLETLYYPPVYNLVYFAARHARMLETYLAEHNATTFPFPEIDVVYHALRLALEGGGMTYINMKVNSSCWAEGEFPGNSDVCWDGFLGHADTNALNQSTPHYQDRFFSTAMTLNGLIDAWTYQNGNTSVWLPSTPANVTALVSGAAMYLHHALSRNDTSFDNAFFSGSGKYWEQYPFWYPQNVLYDVRTNQSVDCANITLDYLGDNYYYWIGGVSGAINDTEFATLAGIGCAGISAPWWFSGYNGEFAYHHPDGPHGHAWPFWSAPVMSHALALQGFAKARVLLSF